MPTARLISPRTSHDHVKTARRQAAVRQQHALENETSEGRGHFRAGKG